MVVTCLFVLASVSPASAAERIRVLLAQNLPEVEGSAVKGVDYTAGSAKKHRSRVRIAWTPQGLWIDGEAVTSPRIVLATGSAELVIQAGASSFSVSGTVSLINDAMGMQVVNELDLEDYVKGVVPSEMSAGWHQEALRVQAVAARTYAVHQRLMNPLRDYDVVATTQDQVYRGRERLDRRVDRAVEATRGLVLTFQNLPIFAAFSSTAAGPTEDAANVWAKDLPYLKGVDCPFDAKSPYYQWRTPLQVPELEEVLRRQGISVGRLNSITVDSRSRAGRVIRLRVLHSDGELMIRGEELRRLVGYSVIPSTQFDVSLQGAEVLLLGRGAGHAVGLCQWGAKELAERGYSYRTILQYYFPGTELKDLRLLATSARALP
jgi:stage II sporulation protein D